MSTIPFTAPTPHLTPAGAVLLLCERLPERFRLGRPGVGFRRGPDATRTSFMVTNLEIDTGPGWTHGGVYVQDGSPELHEHESSGMTFNAVMSFCFDERVPMRFELNPEDPWVRACTVVIGPGDRHGRGSAPTPATAALLALADHLQKRTS